MTDYDDSYLKSYQINHAKFKHLLDTFKNSFDLRSYICKGLAKVSSGGSKDLPPLRPKNISILCKFWGNLAKSYVGAPRRLASPVTWNPGSAPGEGGLSELIQSLRVFRSEPHSDLPTL